MKKVSIKNKSQPLNSPIQANFCDSFFCKFRGLMLRRSLETNDGLLLVQKRENRSESTIHMLFMLMDLAVVWINSAHQVVDIGYARRWRLMYAPKAPAKYVLELHINRLDDFHEGDQLQIDEIQPV